MDETREVRSIHKLMLYGADPYIMDNHDCSAVDYLEGIEDDSIRQQCYDLFNDVRTKKNGLFPSIQCCRNESKGGRNREKSSKLYVRFLSTTLILQFVIFLLYIFPTLNSNSHSSS